MRTILLILRNTLLIVPLVFLSSVFSYLPCVLLKDMSSHHAFVFGGVYLVAFLYWHKHTDKPYRFLVRSAMLSMLNLLNGADPGIATFVNMYMFLDAYLTAYFLSLQGRLDAFYRLAKTVNFLRDLPKIETPLHHQVRCSIQHQRELIEQKYI